MFTPKFPDHTEAQFTDIRGARVAYREKGKGEPMLFMHGAGLTRRWLPLYEELSKEARLIAPEHPGWGESTLPDWMRDFVDMSAHYSDFLRKLDLDKVHLVGHSLGGWVAAEFAALYPEKVSSLTLIAPAGVRPPEHVKTNNMFGPVAPGKIMTMLVGADAERLGPYFDEGDPAEQSWQDYLESVAAARFIWNPRYDIKLEHRLQRVFCPAQIIMPQNDSVIPLEIGQRYAELIPNARLKTLKGKDSPTEHLLIVQEPKRLAREILTFANDAK